MIELSVLKLFCKNKKICEDYFPYVLENRSLDRDLRILFRLVKDFYEKYPESESIAEQDLNQFYDYQYPSSREKPAFTELIMRVFALEPNEALIKDLLEQMIEKQHATQLINKLLPVMEGRQFGVMHHIKEDVDCFLGKLENPPVEYNALAPCAYSVEELIHHEINDVGLRWPLDALNYTIGGVRPGTLGVIFAYVDTGKTSFGVAAAANFCRQLIDTDECVVYAGNEESAMRLSLRITQAFLNCTRQDIKNDPVWAEEVRQSEGFGRIKILDNVGTMGQIIKIFEMHRPRVLFVDQGTKIETRVHDNEVRAAQQLFNFYRESAKKYNCSVICLAQAVGEAENKKWLRLSDIYGSRVAIQGELDYAIGIGRRVEDATTEMIRFFHVPKNKMLEGESTKFPATFHKEKCLWVPA
jgi:hypothetical protein